jgi:hypothetical protein
VLVETDGAVFRLSRPLVGDGLDLRPAVDVRGQPFPFHSVGDGALPLEEGVETMSTKSSDCREKCFQLRVVLEVV